MSQRKKRLGLISAVAAALVLTSVVPAGAAPPPGHGHPHGEAITMAKLPAPPRPPKQPVHRPTRPVPAVPSTSSSVSPTDGARSTTQSINAADTGAALVLYDSTNTFGWLGELYGEQAANLVGHFGSYKAEPVTSYTAGQMAGFTAVIYIGSTYDEPLPAAFLSDVLTTTKPVLWMGFNIWQLTNADPTFTTDYGWNWTGFDFATVNSVQYKGQTLARDGTNNQGGILNVTVSDPAKASVLATSVRSDGSTFPWATRAKNLTYVGEVPFSYEGMSDRYLIASDLLFDALAPTTATRHRALVRIEDVGPDANPTELRNIANTLSGLRVPFSFGVYPVYTDPRGVYNNGTPVTLRLRDVPGVVSAIKYMQSHGGTMLDHGYTHQFGTIDNPYDGVSGDDFEFFTAHVDAANYVRLDGPVPGDSTAWAQGRIASAAAEYQAAGLAVPTIWEFPHYAGSVTDYQAVASKFSTRYERSLYFSGQLRGGAVDYSHINGQFFPYVVRDIYGTKVLPENIGNVEREVFNNNPVRLPADIIASAKANLVVRDGFASFFYHPFLGTTDLSTIVRGIQGLGYTFVAPGTL